VHGEDPETWLVGGRGEYAFNFGRYKIWAAMCNIVFTLSTIYNNSPAIYPAISVRPLKISLFANDFNLAYSSYLLPDTLLILNQGDHNSLL
jgi:hypothetical protein